MDPVNLGRKYNSPCCMPAEVSKADSTISFPSVYLENLPANVKLPDRGRITFEYELVSVNERVKDEKTCYSLDLLQLVSTTGKSSVRVEPRLAVKSSDKPAETGADALDKFAAKIQGDDEGSDEEGSDRSEYVAE